jgi:hypothetical protein
VSGSDAAFGDRPIGAGARRRKKALGLPEQEVDNTAHNLKYYSREVAQPSSATIAKILAYHRKSQGGAATVEAPAAEAEEEDFSLFTAVAKVEAAEKAAAAAANQKGRKGRKARAAIEGIGGGGSFPQKRHKKKLTDRKKRKEERHRG